MPDPSLLGGLTPRAFLARHWQKRPLLVRGALPDFSDPVDRHALFDLACQQEVDSRLVRASGGRRPFELTEGPQQARQLRGLPVRAWTLLVRRADHHVPALADLFDIFDFLPRWRMHDVMLSFSAPGGSVGPHIDNYDVFLVQGGGSRRWQVQIRPDPSLRPGLDLRVLRRFVPDASWDLEPGDMLYVPPGVAHNGVSLSESFTYSIGFRAPSERALLAAFAEKLFQEAAREKFYEDPDLQPATRSGLVTATATRRLMRMLRRAVAKGLRDDLRPALAAQLTAEGSSTPRARPLKPPQLERLLRTGNGLARSPAARAAYLRVSGGLLLLVDGETHRTGRELEPLVAALAGARRVPPRLLARYAGRGDVLRLLLDLVNAGAYSVASAERTPAAPARG